MMKELIYLTILFSILLAACAGGTGAGALQRVAITHVNLVPMTEEIVLADQTVLIEGSRIAAVGPADDIDIPRDATVIDGTGAYLMPGLADMHMHTTPAWETEWPIFPFLLYLANGVTTVRNLDPLPDESGQDYISPDYVLAWRDGLLSGDQPGPTMYTTGLSLQGVYDWRPSVLEAGDAQAVVQENADKGYDFLKIFEYFPAEHFAEAMAAANANNMYLTGHIPFEVGLEDAVALGMDEIAHVIPILYWERLGIYTPGMTRDEFLQRFGPAYLADWDGVDPDAWYGRERETIAGIVELLRSHGVNICTTGVGPDITKALIADYDSYIQREDMQVSRRRFLELIARGEDSAQQAFTQFPQLMEPFIYERNVWLRELQEAGVMLILGTDSGVGMGIVPGFSVHGELLAMVDAGLTPYEAIVTGTLNASKVVEQMIGIDDFGTIEVGKRADLILVGGDPLQDVSNTQDIRGVMAAGRWHSRQDLDVMLSLDQ
jgi:imidazolonepropionase-like amidohydrolase